MEKHILENGIKLIYDYKQGSLTSFCIGFNAGAIEEDGFPYGTAHSVEHLIFKETGKRKEVEINKLCDEIFGFNNAMTNFPYAIYYGTSLSDDFEMGFELFNDIITNPSFSENGFNEEILVIKEELKEWKDDIYRLLEDELLYNSFAKRRIKYPIIGTKNSIDEINISTVKKFYDKYYTPQNCVISIVSSIPYEKIIEVVYKYFGAWKKNFDGLSTVIYEENLQGKYICNKKTEGAKIQILYPIHRLTNDEVITLSLFNKAFGEGTSSILYDNVRTKYGLAYDIWTSLKKERGIKLYSIGVGTSRENVDRVISLTEQCIDSVLDMKSNFSVENIQKLQKRINIEKSLKIEKSIVLANELTTNELMYGNKYKFNLSKDIDCDKIIKVALKVLKKPSIEIIY